MAKKRPFNARITPDQLRLMRLLIKRRLKNEAAGKVPMSYREIADLVKCSHTTVYLTATGAIHNDD